MKEKYDALDWQSFSQKKDIENIVKNTKEKKDIQLTATIEIAMGVSSITVENLFGEYQTLLKITNVIIVITALVPLIWLAVKWGKRLYKTHRNGKDIPALAEMIDLFDNEICYYALIAESYAEKVSKKQDLPKAIDQFNFIETCFYINKTIYSLSVTTTSVDKLYSSNGLDLYNNKNVSYTRLKNIIDILDSCIMIVEEYKETIEDIDMKDNYYNLFEECCKEYKSFKESLNSEFLDFIKEKTNRESLC